MRQRFAAEDVENVPEEAGIFCLYQDRDLVYVGRTAPRNGLRTELQHALLMARADDMHASHFTFELTKSPKTRANEELRAFYEMSGRMPLYNRSNSITMQQRAELRR